MEQWGFLIDTESCVACKACEIACKNRNQLGVGPRLRQVSTIEAGEFPDVSIVNVSLACMHCGRPACEAVCPTRAIQKRSQDGIVVVDRDKCIGCHYCFFACPFGVPQFANDGKMIKCDLCLDRLQMGLEPACVRTCFYDALHAGPLTELADLARQRVTQKLGGSTEPSILVLG
jgi:anaerobic dimethyl sulfoxide reductase subunit B (iron-sulfur subunit)